MRAYYHLFTYVHSCVQTYLAGTLAIGLFPKKVRQEFMKGRMFDPSDTYPDTYLDAYLETYPHNVPFVKSPALPNIPETYPNPNMFFLATVQPETPIQVHMPIYDASCKYIFCNRKYTANVMFTYFLCTHEDGGLSKIVVLF